MTSLDAAIATLREDVRSRPHEVSVIVNLGNALGFGGTSTQRLRNTGKLSGSRRDLDARNNLGGLLCDEKLDFVGAAVEFREVIRLDPDNCVAHTSLGNSLSGQEGKLDEAIAAYRKAIRLKPDDAHSHSMLGLALCQQGRVDEAIAAQREAIRLARVYPDASATLASP